MSENNFPLETILKVQEEIDHRLSKLPREKVVLFAHRCALRAIPMLAHNSEFGFWKEEDKNKYLMTILRCLDFSYNYIPYPITNNPEILANFGYVVNVSYSLSKKDFNTDLVFSVIAADAAACALSDFGISDAKYAASTLIDKISSYDVRTKIIALTYRDLEFLGQEKKLPALKDEKHPYVKKFLKALEVRGMDYWANMFREHWEDQVNEVELMNRLEIPTETLEAGEAAVTEYLKSKTREQKKFNEVKAVFIGDGGAGKTALVRKIIDRSAELPYQDEKTEGLGVSEIEFSAKDTKVRIWDFGGQVIYHAAHQLFMTERTVYVVVIDERRENEPDYWLRHTEVFGGKSPVMVVINKWDVHQNGIAEKTLKEKFPAIHGFYCITCKYPDSHDFDRFLSDFEQLCVSNVSWEREFAAEWVAVKVQLSALKQPFISHAAYREVCRKNGITEEKTQQALLNILRNLGVVLYYPEIGMENQVLDPEWISRGMYRILSSKICFEQKGEVKLSQLKEILWSDDPKEKEKFNREIYPERQHNFLLKVASLYELCYFRDDNTVIFPDRLPEDYPDGTRFPEADEDATILRYEFDFLPRVVFTRFLSKMHRDTQSAILWRRGGILHQGRFGNTAFIQVDYEKRYITVEVTGSRRPEFLEIIMRNMAAIFETFREFHVYEKIPVGPQEQNEWDTVPNLVKLLAKGEKTRTYANIEQPIDIASELNRLAPVPFLAEIFQSQLRSKDEEIHRMERMFERGMSAAENFGPKEIKLQSYHKSKVSLDIDITITVKNENVIKAIQDLDLLYGRVKNKNPSEVELLSQIDECKAFLENIEKEEDKEKIKKSGAMAAFREFLKNANDTGSKINEILQTINNGMGLVSNLENYYNTIAQWCGLI